MLTATNDRRAYIRRRSVEVAVRDGALAHVRCINTYPKSLMQGSLLRAATSGPGKSSPSHPLNIRGMGVSVTQYICDDHHSDLPGSAVCCHCTVFRHRRCISSQLGAAESAAPFFVSRSIFRGWRGRGIPQPSRGRPLRPSILPHQLRQLDRCSLRLAPTRLRH